MEFRWRSRECRYKGQEFKPQDVLDQEQFSKEGPISVLFKAPVPAALPFAAAGAGGASAGPADAPASPAATGRARAGSALSL